MDNQQPQLIPSPLQVFNAVKVVLFIETKPLTDKFEQIILSPEAMLDVLKFLETKMTHFENGTSRFVVETNNFHSYTFPNIKDTYTPEDILVLKGQPPKQI